MGRTRHPRLFRDIGVSRPGGDIPMVEVSSRAELRAWLASHHAQAGSIWLVTYKKAAGERYLSYEEIVEEALAFGWVDSLPRELDRLRTMRILAPRKRGSAWSRVNKARIEKLIAEGCMTEAGMARIEQAKADGSWSRLDAVETLTLPADVAEALQARPPAAANFQAFPRSSRRLILEWISSAKGAETRAKRIATTAAMAARNLRANHVRQPGGSRRTRDR